MLKTYSLVHSWCWRFAGSRWWEKTRLTPTKNSQAVMEEVYHYHLDEDGGKVFSYDTRCTICLWQTLPLLTFSLLVLRALKRLGSERASRPIPERVLDLSPAFISARRRAWQHQRHQQWPYRPIANLVVVLKVWQVLQTPLAYPNQFHLQMRPSKGIHDEEADYIRSAGKLGLRRGCGPWISPKRMSSYHPTLLRHPKEKSRSLKVDSL